MDSAELTIAEGEIVIFQTHASARSAGRHSQSRHAAPKGQNQNSKARTLRITKMIPAAVLALLLTGSGTAAAGGQSSLLGAGAVGDSYAASRSEDREDLLNETTQLSVTGTYVSEITAETVYIDAPLSQNAQDAHTVLLNNVDTASKVYSDNKSYATRASLKDLSDAIDDATALANDGNASLDSLNQANSTLAQASNKVSDEATKAKIAAQEEKAEELLDELKQQIADNPSALTSTEGQGTSNGDDGNKYAWHQCTWWAYERRKQMGIGTPSYLGNGGQWYLNAAKYGLRADHTPQVGAAISFLPGQEGASTVYGHVGVVEQVNEDGSIVISEYIGGLSGNGHLNMRTFENGAKYWYVH